jgi:hypothetical protein
MTKAEAKIQIQKIKETIADKKYRYGIFNDGLKRQIEHEKKSKSIQKDPSTKKRIQSQIEYLKKQFASTKLSQTREIDSLKQDIQRIKNSAS